jgi:serine O-acetyltransferase
MLSFFEDLKCYREGLMAQGFWALQIHRFCMLRRRFQSPLVRKPWGLVHVILIKLSEILFGIYIGSNAVIGRRLVIEHFGYVVIHANTVIGDDVIVRQGVTIGNRFIDRPLDAPVIGSKVNIGAGAVLLGKITIGDNVDIGANAVVLCDVPDNHIAVGVPARILPKKAKNEGKPT